MTDQKPPTNATIPPPLPTHDWSPPAEPDPDDAATDSGPRCELCGGRRAAPVTFHQGIGLLLARKVRTVSGTYCRNCGLALGRSTGNSTLWTGWWGIISFFTNIGYVLGNAGSLIKHARLGKPRGSASSLDPGRPLLFRSGTLFLVALVATLGLVVANADGSSRTSSNSQSSAGLENDSTTLPTLPPTTLPPTPPTTALTLPSVGACLLGGDRIGTLYMRPLRVPCSSGMSQVLAISATDPNQDRSACPADATSVLTYESSPAFLCMGPYRG